MNMSADQNDNNEARNMDEIEETDPASRVIETKHVFPEEYECKSNVKKENKCMKPPKLDETICRPITSNKLNETLKHQKCSHCGESIGQCKCLSDEARRELTRIHEYKNNDETNEEGEEISKLPENEE